MTLIEQMIKLYVEDKLSFTQVGEIVGKSRGQVYHLIGNIGISRTQQQGSALAGSQGRLSSRLGVKLTFTEEHKRKISESRLAKNFGIGYCVTNAGYERLTKGPNKGRPVHVEIMENHLGRKLAKDEVVHHIDHNKRNNHISNLQVMTNSEHMRMHALESPSKRDKLTGRFLPEKRNIS